MSKNIRTVVFTAEGYGSGGEAVGKTADKTTLFVKNMLEGETAEVAINYEKNGVAYGEPSRFLAVSPKRMQPPCPYYGQCGGCALQHMSYDEQLIFKQKKVIKNLNKLGGIAAEVKETFPSSAAFNYRNKLSLPVGGKKGEVKIGMFKAGTHEIIDLKSCLLGGEWADKTVEILREYFNKYGIEPYDERSFSGNVRHVVARYVSNQLLLTVVSNGPFKTDTAPLVAALAKSFESFGLFINENTGRNNVILGKKTEHVYGIKYIKSEHFGIKFLLAPDSFFQVNDSVKDSLYTRAKQLLDNSKTEILADCFSGIGILTGAVCSDKYDTYAIEIQSSSHSDAEQMKRLNGIKRLTNICGDVNAELPRLTQRYAGKNMSLIVDPPRKGLGQSVCETVVKAEFDNIIYISCDSATLARDVKYLSDFYSIATVEPFDMFPQTDDVETLVVMRKKTALQLD